MIALDRPHATRHHLPVPFNSGTGIGVPNQLADSRHFAAFFASVTYAMGASMVSMVGRSGGVLARAGFQLAGTPTLLRACHPDWRRDGGSHTQLEATMPSFALRAFRALFARSPAVSIIRPAADLAEARRMAADLIAQDRRCSVRITAGSRGFDVDKKGSNDAIS